MNKINLICLPYAGGSVSSLCTYLNSLNENINLCLIELPGRGKRMNEKLLDNIDMLLENIFENIKQIIDSGEMYAIMGYSMGSILAYELYYMIKAASLQLPKHIFFCAGRTPDAYDDFKKAKLDDEAIIEGIDALGGLSKDILSNKKIKGKFVPVIRADYKVIQSYFFTEGRQLIECNISAICGEDDDQSISTIYRWQEFAAKKTDCIVIKGGHFFIKTYKDVLCEHINQLLQQHIS
jgi:surfactin synthase thioesterase subunit